MAATGRRSGVRSVRHAHGQSDPLSKERYTIETRYVAWNRLTNFHDTHLCPVADDMSMRLDLADLTIAWLISGRSLWALCCALSIFIFAYSTYFFLLLRSRGRCPDDGVLTPRSLQEVLKIHDAVMRERIRSGKI